MVTFVLAKLSEWQICLRGLASLPNSPNAISRAFAQTQHIGSRRWTWTVIEPQTNAWRP